MGGEDPGKGEEEERKKKTVEQKMKRREGEQEVREKERKKRVGGNEEEVEERRVREKMEVVDRRVGVAVDFAACSKEALRWAVENIIRDDDHLILLTVLLEGHYEEGEMQLWEASGSPLIPLSEFCDPILTKKYGVKPDAETLDIASCVARQKDIVVLMEVYWGDAREKICEAIENVPLSCLVIGNRGLGKIKRSEVEGIREDCRNRTGFSGQRQRDVVFFFASQASSATSAVSSRAEEPLYGGRD